MTFQYLVFYNFRLPWGKKKFSFCTKSCFFSRKRTSMFQICHGKPSVYILYFFENYKMHQGSTHWSGLISLSGILKKCEIKLIRDVKMYSFNRRFNEVARFLSNIRFARQIQLEHGVSPSMYTKRFF